MFLVNYWPSLIITLIGVGCFGFFHVIKFFFKEKQIMKKKVVLSVIDFLVLGSFNFIIIQIYGMLDEIVLYFILQVRFGEFFSGLYIGSSIVGVALLLFGVYILVIHFGIIYKYNKLKKNKESLEDFMKKFEYFQVLYQDFKDTAPLRHSFFAWLILRTILCNLIIVTLYEKPLIQAICFMIINFIMIGLLISKRPFKEIYGNLTLFFYEAVLFIAYFCVLVMAIADETKKTAVDLRETLSRCIMLLNVILLIGSLAFVSIQLFKKIVEIHEAYKEYKEKGKRRIKDIRKEDLKERLTLETSRNILFNTLDSERSAFGEIKNQDQKTKEKSVEINFGNDTEEDQSYYFGPKHIQNRMKPKSTFMKEKSEQNGSKLASFHTSPSKKEEQENRNFDGIMELKEKVKARKKRRTNTGIFDLDPDSKDSHNE